MEYHEENMLRNVIPIFAPTLPTAVVANGRRYPVVVRRVKNARRMRLRIDPLRDQIIFTLPPRATERRALHFWREKEYWVRESLDTLAPRVSLVFGEKIPVLGEEVTIVSGWKTSRAKNPLSVLATDSMCEETVKRILIQRLMRYIEPKAKRMAAKIGAEVGSVVIRDTTSCWGSCTRDGRLMFSWRLVFAPKFVLDYLIAHEVAHLKELNHSKRFWALNTQLCPRLDEAREWLNTNGHSLYRYGSA